MPPIKLGIWAPVWGSFLGQKEEPSSVTEATFDFNAKYIQYAESLGFHSVLLLDRSLNSTKGIEAPILEAWVTASALAPITNSIELIVASRSAYRHPGLVAQMGANLDRISKGRFAINIVSGWWGLEHDMNGIPFPEHDKRYDISSEVIEILKKFWEGEVFDFNGNFFKINQGITSPLPVRKPWPTIYFGGESDAAIHLAARAADVFLFNGRPLSLAKDLISRVKKENAIYKKDLKFGMSAFVICRKTDSEAEEELERLIKSLGVSEELQGVDKDAIHKKTSSRSKGIGSNGGIAADLVGSADTICERMIEFNKEGVELFLLQFHPMFEEIERFSREVMPLLPIGKGQKTNPQGK
tara:strand:- start:41628 stop:42692 length:1065 start_codon:yes stop_codon:yes gene_type:complete